VFSTDLSSDLSQSKQAPNLLAQAYDKSWSFYRSTWLNGDNLAIHLGYWGDNTKTHAESLIQMNQVMAERISLRSGRK